MSKIKFILSLVATIAFIFGCGGKKANDSKKNLANKDNSSPAPQTPKPKKPSLEAPKRVALQIVQTIKKNNLAVYPELTLAALVDTPLAATSAIQSAGGQVHFDSRKGYDNKKNTILIFTLPPEKFTDAEFLKSLALKSASVDHPKLNRVKPVEMTSAKMDINEVHVPIEDIGIPALQARQKGKGLGEGTVIAIIDTGVDANHPVFQDRVVYWADETQEGRVIMKSSSVKEGQVQVAGKPFKLPAAMASAKTVYVGVVDEAAMGTQSSDSDKTKGKAGLDYNNDGKMDGKFSVVAAILADGQMIAVFDINADGVIDKAESASLVTDFNFARKEKPKGLQDMVVFQKGEPGVKYPVLFEKEGETLKYITLGADFGGHGTHVAGIAAANGPQIIGAAPAADIMAMKVCSGLTCTDAAILRALVKTFENESGIIPDIVNISLGSHEQYNEDIYSLVMRDLAAKYGATFFISASNSGPGYRSLNAIGSFGPVIQVAAHVSKKSMLSHYNLQNETDVHEQNLLYFTSLGPSFTGQLRPNISAPGSALSSIPVNNGGSAMWNGTSMSSPISAGAAAALLSLAKTDTKLAPSYKRLNDKIAEVKSGNLSSIGSVAGIPMALRAALQETATTMPDYTVVHQGAGLIDVNAALDRYVEILSKWEKNQVRFFELSLNGDTKKNRLYDRSAALREVRRIEFGLKEDSERTFEQTKFIENTTMIVRLEKVQVQNTDGTTEVISGEDLKTKAPISLSKPGIDKIRGVERQVHVGDSVRVSVESFRHLNEMIDGKTYVAHYSVSQSGQEVFSFVDIVHKPLQFFQGHREHWMPSICESGFCKSSSSIGMKNQQVVANGMHRIPIAVTEAMTEVHLKIGLKSEQGRLNLKIYNPDGKAVGSEWVLLSQKQESNQKTASIKVNTAGKPGIYEITVGASSGRWMGRASYDLLVEAVEFKPSVSKITLASDAALSVIKDAKMKSSETIFIANSSKHIKEVKTTLKNAKYIFPLPDLKVMPNRWTYRKIVAPKLAGINKTDAVVRILPGKGEIIGRIHHNLFQKVGDEYKVITKSSGKDDGDNTKTFKNIDFSQPDIYIAVETFMTYSGETDLAKPLTSIAAEVAFAVEVPKESLPQVQFIGPTKDANSFAIQVTAPKEVAQVGIGEKLRPVLRATLEVTTDRKDVLLSLPVVISQ